MKPTLSSTSKYLVAAMALLTFSLVYVDTASADGSRTVNRNWSTAGGSGGMSKSVTRGDGMWNRDVTRSGPNGYTLERNTQRSYDPGTGSSYSNTTTLPSGATMSRSRSVTQTESGVAAERQVTGPQGASRSVTRTLNW